MKCRYMGPGRMSLLGGAVPRSHKSRELPQINVLQNITISIPESSRMSELEPLLSLAGSSACSMSLAETQTPKFLSAETPRKLKISAKLNSVEEENKLLKMDIEKLQKQNQLQREVDANVFKKLCDNFLNPEMAAFVKSQVDLLGRASHGARYSNEFKKFALSLYFLGPRCYRQLKKTFVLPSKRVLERYAEKMRLTEGINDQLFSLLKLKVDRMEDDDRICALCIDEITIKTNLFYNYGNDEVIGFASDGITRTSDPASSAATIMVRGIKRKWKQPLGYLFTKTSYPGEQTKNTLEKYVEKLTAIGLNVTVMITDMGSNFIQLANMLGVTPKNPKFKLGDKDIFYLFDPPHMIKAVRNMLMKHTFCWGNYYTSWNFIEEFYQSDKDLISRMAPKLTKKHLFPTNFEKQKVKLATQVLSSTVAAGLETYIHLNRLPQEALGTKLFVSRFDALFDVFNASETVQQKPFRNAFRGQKDYVSFLQETLDFLDKLCVVDKNSKDVTANIKWITAWKISIASLLSIWEYLHTIHQFKFLLTRNLNQDCLENFFGNIRQQSGNAINPTPIQFRRCFKKLFLMSYFHSENMNCANDFNRILLDLSNFKTIKNNVPSVEEVPITMSFDISHTDYRDKSLPEQNAFKYVVGYLIKNCLNVHRCATCTKFAEDDSELNDSNIFIHFKAYSNNYKIFGSLKTPRVTL